MVSVNDQGFVRVRANFLTRLPINGDSMKMPLQKRAKEAVESILKPRWNRRDQYFGHVL
jgi:hypothetical protein